MWKKEEVNTYWWSGAGNANFGDVLGPRLVEHFTNKKCVLVPAKESELVVIGSIAEHLPKEGYAGTVAGIGFGYAKGRCDLSQANVLALRGELSLNRARIKNKPLLADPGLVAPDLINVSKVNKKFELGVIGHHKHHDIEVPDGALKIDIKWPIEDVIEAAASCEAISSSSLHGIILADSLGLPRQWVHFDIVQGKGFKFFDYYTSIKQKALPGEWKIAPEGVVQKKQEALREMLSCL